MRRSLYQVFPNRFFEISNCEYYEELISIVTLLCHVLLLLIALLPKMTGKEGCCLVLFQREGFKTATFFLIKYLQMNWMSLV